MCLNDACESVQQQPAETNQYCEGCGLVDHHCVDRLYPKCRTAYGVDLHPDTAKAWGIDSAAIERLTCCRNQNLLFTVHMHSEAFELQCTACGRHERANATRSGFKDLINQWWRQG